MAKELMWVCALLPPKINRQLVDLCREANSSIGLPDDVFRFPLHISMKKSFQTTEFEAVKAEIIQHIQAQGEIHCRTTGVVCHKKMLWLMVEPEHEVGRWHDELDQHLLNKFSIPIDRLDVNFVPHISLFTKGDPAQMEKMGLRLADQIPPMELTLGRFVIGSSGHGDEFFDISDVPG